MTKSKRTAPSRLVLLSSMALLIAACGGPAPTPTEQSGTIRGQIQPWTAGAVTQAGYSETQSEAFFVSANVDSGSGGFTMPLPNVAAMTSTHAKVLMPAGDVFGACDNVTQNIPADLKLRPLNNLYTEKWVAIYAPLDTTAPQYAYKAWWFANMAATLKFKGDCIGLGKVDTTLSLKRGWNVLDVRTNVGVSSTYSLTTEPAQAMKWTYASAEALGPQGLTFQNIFTPWKNLPQYQGR